VLVLVRRRDGGLFDAKGVMPVRVGAAVGAVRREAATHDHQHLAPVVRESYQAYMLGELAADMHVLM
jgi:hypothetical protein